MLYTGTHTLSESSQYVSLTCVPMLFIGLGTRLDSHLEQVAVERLSWKASACFFVVFSQSRTAE